MEKMGDEQRQSFIKECARNPKRFEEAIQKNKLYLFKSIVKKIIAKSKNNKIEEFRAQRDLFGVLLNMVLTYQKENSNKNLDMKSILAKPIIKQPPCFCHPDGTICKTDKSIFMKFLEEKAPTTTEFKGADIVIIDGFAMIYKLNLPPT